jgi:hypothetical protein
MSQGSLRDLLAGYDRDVDQTLREVLDAPSGTECVQLVYKLRRVVSVHDSVLGSALCPLLEDLPGGSAVAERLLQGCHERAELWTSFRALTDGVNARDVYRVSGVEVDRILKAVRESFCRHENDETTQVADMLEASEASSDPEVLAVRMVLESERAPTRVHWATTKFPASSTLHHVYRYMDKIHDWSDTHHGWVR